jgi:hypothetical protein
MVNMNPVTLEGAEGYAKVLDHVQSLEAHAGEECTRNDYLMRLYSLAPRAAAGVKSFDMGDIYPGVEEVLGVFVHRHLQAAGADARVGMKLLTKFVPDEKMLTEIDQDYVTRYQNILSDDSFVRRRFTSD